MMNYELFKKIAAQRVLDFMPEDFAGYTPDIRPVNKINGVKDGFCLMPPEHKKNRAIPTLYLDELYEDFSQDEDMDRVLSCAASVFAQYAGMPSEGLASYLLEDHTDMIVGNLISTELNSHLLENVPNREFLDMSLIYRFVYRNDDHSMHTAIITNEHMESAGLTEDDLYKFALENTSRIFPIKVLDGFGEKFIVVTNEIGAYGASVMLYEDEMKKLAERIGGDFYILPSSVHELFLTSASESDPIDLVNMLAEGNEKITPPAERLSTVIYRYVAEHEKIIRYLGYLDDENVV